MPGDYELEMEVTGRLGRWQKLVQAKLQAGSLHCGVDCYYVIMFIENDGRM